LDQSGAVDILLAYPTLIKRPVLEWQATVSVGFTTDDYADYFDI
jgi:arsenate reductase